MSLALLVIAAVSVVNGPRVRAALPERDPVLVGALGAVVGWVVLVPLAAGAGLLLDPVVLAASTVRMAAGVVLLVQGGVALVLPSPRPEPSLPGRRAALVPVAFPVTLTPGLGLLAVSGALDRSAPVALAAVAAALTTIPILALVRSTGSPLRTRALAGVARLTSGALILCGAGLLVNGLFDV